LSSWKICLDGTPLAFHTIHVSTVVAAHWISPDRRARWRLACGIFRMLTSRPFFSKMPASFASVSGAKPVQPDMPIETAVSAWAAEDINAAAETAITQLRFMVRTPVYLFMGHADVLTAEEILVTGFVFCLDKIRASILSLV